MDVDPHPHSWSHTVSVPASDPLDFVPGDTSTVSTSRPKRPLPSRATRSSTKSLAKIVVDDDSMAVDPSTGSQKRFRGNSFARSLYQPKSSTQRPVLSSPEETQLQFVDFL